MKPSAAGCTDKWTRGKVTGVNSRNNIEVNCHILDVRPIETAEATEGHEFSGEEFPEQRSESQRRAPEWMRDFESQGLRERFCGGNNEYKLCI